MQLDAIVLSNYQSCKRKFLLSTEYRVIRWRPKLLFDSVLRNAIVHVSNGEDVSKCVAEARAQFMQTAANPGLEVTGNPYQIAKDYCAMMDTILRSLYRLTLLTVKSVSPVRLKIGREWRVLSYADQTGELHRWITVDNWNDDTLAREAHSWFTAGDMAVTGQPMTLHAIEIGQNRNGRRASPWARAYKHPAMAQLPFRFRQKTGEALNGWKPYYLADDSSIDPERWVDRLWSEGVAQELVHHVRLEPLSERVTEDTRHQILMESLEMERLFEERGSSPWSAQPMSRGECDGIVPCGFQDACYNRDGVLIDIMEIGLYCAKDQELAYR